jgi:hypothetical protein
MTNEDKNFYFNNMIQAIPEMINIWDKLGKQINKVKEENRNFTSIEFVNIATAFVILQEGIDLYVRTMHAFMNDAKTELNTKIMSEYDGVKH